MSSSALLADFDSRCAGGSDIVGHLPYLRERALQASVAIELGVRSGESTSAFLAALDASGGHLWSVDVDLPAVPSFWFELPGWHFLHGDDTDPTIADRLPAECDLLFIDTSHRYGHTLSELATYGPRVRAGGVILLHDTDLEVAPGSVAMEDREYPVRRAVNDWCRQVGLTPDFRAGSNGLGVIEVTDG